MEGIFLKNKGSPDAIFVCRRSSTDLFFPTPIPTQIYASKKDFGKLFHISPDTSVRWETSIFLQCEEREEVIFDLFFKKEKEENMKIMKFKGLLNK